jgi:hypothetical protein
VPALHVAAERGLGPGTERVDESAKKVLWGQFGAAIDMLESGMTMCPDDVWAEDRGPRSFWYLVFHTLFFLDYYLSDSEEDFRPPPPFTLTELDPAGVMPDRIYTREELGRYLEHGRAKCRRAIASLTEAKASERRRMGSTEGTVAERLLYNLRHVQHHAAQLYLILRERVDSAPRWVGRTPLDLRAP